MERDYQISDDGDAVQVAFFQDGAQIGGAYFPDDDGDGSAFEFAREVGEQWKTEKA